MNNKQLDLLGAVPSLPCAAERATWRASLDAVKAAEVRSGLYCDEVHALTDVTLEAQARLHDAMERAGTWLTAEPEASRCGWRTFGATPRYQCRLARHHAGECENELGQRWLLPPSARAVTA